MGVLSTSTVIDWNARFKRFEQKAAIEDLESGKLIYCPQLSFNMKSFEQALFVPYYVNKKTKNISFDPKKNRLKGIRSNDEHQMQVKAMSLRFSQQASQLISHLLSDYAQNLIVGRTSYRPIQVKNRKSSPRKDDRCLHVDAFPASPNQGKRILRLFCNINPYGEHRIWRIGETFSEVAKRFLPRIPRPIFGSSQFLHWLGITKGIRTYYDHIMLKIHDYMKLDKDYQRQVNYTELSFPPGSSWIVFTDQISHAAVSGQYILEQTFYLPTAAMQNPKTSPLCVLEDLIGHRLT